jgi:hypothetical protein
MVNRQIIAKTDGLDDVGSLVLPLQWRMDARSVQNRASRARPWQDEELRLPLESVGVQPEKVLYWDKDPARENSVNRVGYMLASRAVPLVVDGGNTMRNVVDRLENRETEDLAGYSYSRILLARRVLLHLQTEPDLRVGHLRRANLHVIFRYAPPQDEALVAFIDVLRRKEV